MTTPNSEPRRVDLPDGRHLIVRPTTRDDVAGLKELFDSLSLDDLHRRFFSAFHPPVAFLEGWASLAERGGLGLVAVLDDGGQQRVVGEAGYSLLDSGDGEFAITVAPDWRGWLGPYLLDALAEEAAARGVSALIADVLLENRPMLALVRARGHVTLDNEDFTVVRVAIGTRSRTPAWPEATARDKVLVESPSARWRAGAQARAAGFQVVACPGPDARSLHTCPALRGEPCPLAASADAIVFALPPSSPHGQALLEAHRRLHPDVPVVIDRGGAQDEPSAGSEGATPCEGCVLPAGTPASEAIARLRDVIRSRAS